MAEAQDRQIVSPSDIEEYITRKMRTLPDCATCTPVKVVWCLANGDGCNWNLSGLEGPHSSECLLQLVPLLQSLKANFKIAEATNSLPEAD